MLFAEKFTLIKILNFHIWLGGGWVVGKANLSALTLDLNLGFVFDFQTRSEPIIKEKENLSTKNWFTNISILF